MATQTRPRPKKRWRRGTPPNPRLAQPDFPFTMKLPDGRTLFVAVPGRWMAADRDGTPAFTPAATRFLDRVQALATSALDRPPSPGFITTLREALGLTQEEMGERLGVHKLTVSRWERGTLRPRAETLRAIEALRRESTRRGVTLPT